jgi:hypothetical protein
MNEHKVDIAAKFEGEGQRQSSVMIPAPSQGSALNHVTHSIADGYTAAYEDLGEKTPLRHDLTGQSVAEAEVYTARDPLMTPTPANAEGSEGCSTGPNASSPYALGSASIRSASTSAADRPMPTPCTGCATLSRPPASAFQSMV